LTYIIQEKTIKRNYEKHTIQNKYFFESIQINSEVVREMWTYFVASGLTTAPSIAHRRDDSLIYNDCGATIFETSNDGHYRKNIYDCLSMRPPKLQYRQAVLDFSNFYEKRLNLNSVFGAFTSKLPRGEFYTDGFVGFQLLPKAERLTPAQRKKRIEARRIRIYLDSIGSVVDTYLTTFLSKPDLVSDSLSCYYNDYRILIGKDGRLKRVQISEKNKPRLRTSGGLRSYLEERRDIYKCIRAIRVTLQPIDLSFLNLQAEVKRTIGFETDGKGALKKSYDW
jgi:hypothetical protein